MKTYQDLEIHLDNDKYQEYVEDLSSTLEKTDWKVRNDIASNYKKNSFSTSKIVLCIETPELHYEDNPIKGVIWIWDYSGYLEVFNITPLIGNNLDFDQYNFILNQFYSLFIDPLNSKYSARIILSKPLMQINETIGNNAYEALVSFSNGANKSTGNTHPFDFQRWCEFIFVIFRNEIKLGASELIVWLEENGWSNDMAYKLGLEFEYSLNLLEKYEQNR